MWKKGYLVVFLLALVMVLSLTNGDVQALNPNTDQCTACHGTKVLDFKVLPGNNVKRLADFDANGNIVNNSACWVCHREGYHGLARADRDYIVGAGYFSKTANQSVYSSFQILHFVHDGYNGGRNTVAGNTCAKSCHTEVKCQSCHQTVSHSTHGTTNLTFQAATKILADGITSSAVVQTCSTSYCHNGYTKPSRYANATTQTELCINCHSTPVVQNSQGSAKDSSGHNAALLGTTHSTVLPNQLVVGGAMKAVDCSGCHVNPLTTEHANRARDCSVCHNSTNTAIINVINTAGKQQVNRACDKCHFNTAVLAPPTGNLRTEHQLYHIAAQSNSLRVDGAPHATCNTCHQRTTPVTMQIVSGSVYTPTSLAQLAASPIKDYSCLSCHTGAPNPKAPIHQAGYNNQPQQLTDFHPGCNTCHDPNATYKNSARKPADDVNTIIATKNGVYSCTDCHTNLAAGHKAQFSVNGPLMTTTDYHLNCATCHSSADPGVKAAITTYSGTSGYACQSCHSTTSTAASPPYSPLHSARGDEITGYHPAKSCDSCHGVVNGAYKVNLNAIKPKVLAGGYGCAACHGTLPGIPMGKHAGLTTATAAPTDVSAKYHANCATCHKDARVTAKVTTLKSSGVTGYQCSECHNTTIGLAPKHRAEMSVSTTVYGAVYEITQFHIDATGAVSCDKCHDNNTVLSTATIKNLKIQPGYKCASCHTAALAPNHTAALAANGTPEATVGFHKDCQTCHTNIAVKTNINTGTFKTAYLCTTCHNATIAPQPNHMAKADTNATSENISTTYHATCNKCHGNAGYPAVDNIIKQTAAARETDYLCTKCHNATLNLEPKHKAKMAVSDIVYATVTDYHLDTAGKTACGMCHGTVKLPAGTIGTLKAAPSYLCDDCHTPASLIKYSHTANFGAAAPGQKTTDYHKACQTCHDSVKAKPVIKSLIGQSGYDCAQCHNGTTAAKALHRAKTSATVADAVYTVKYHPSCATCHSSKNTGVANIITVNTGTSVPYTCNDCHTGTLAAKHNANWTTVGGKVYGFETTQFHANCDQCHQSPKPAVKTQIGIINTQPTYNCTDCHSGTVAAQARHVAGLTVGGKVYEATVYHAKLGTTAQDACLVCHNNPAVAADKAAIFTKTQAGQGYLCQDCHKNPAKAPYAPNHLAVLDSEVFDTLTLHPACTTCHATAADITIRTLKGKSGYSCNMCHTDVTAKHLSPTVLTGSMVNCSWCHTNQLIDTHLKPVIKLPNQMQCTTCHSTAATVRTQVQMKQKACADCHNGTSAGAAHPDAQYIPRHIATFPSFMPEYNPTCVNCHSGSTPGATPNVITLHTPYMIGCVTCHTTPAYKPAVMSLSTDCSGCHDKSVKPAMDMTATHDNFHTVNVALNQSSAQCLSCHKADSVTASVYTVYSSVYNLLPVHQKKPAYTKVANCDACHGTAARPEVKQAIAANNTNCTACHQNADHKHPVAAYEATADVKCVNCHATGTDPVNNTVKTTELSAVHSKYGKSCAACHTSPFQGSVIAGDGAIDMLKNATAPIYCSTCHNGQPGYPLTREVRHAPEHQAAGNENVTCNVCHDGITVKGDFNAPTGTVVNFTGIHTSNNCNTCHDNAKVDRVITLRVGKANPAYSCAECHDGTKAATHNKLHTVKSYLNGSTDTGCASCHSNGDVVAVHSGTTSTGKVLNCNTCHSATPVLPNTIPVVKANLSNLKNADGTLKRTGYTCQDCHSDISGGHQHNITAAGYAATPNVDCGTCHATGVNKTAELATIHQQAATAGKIANYSCATCHNSTFVGSVIGDGKLDMLKNGTPIYCNACHDGVKADAVDKTTGVAKPAKYPEHAGTHDKAKGFGTYAWDSNVDCSKCHTSMDIAPVHDSARNPANVTCNSCHTSSNAAVTKVITDNLSRNPRPAGFTCADCHNTLPYKHAYEHKATSTEKVTCNSCHDGTTVKGSFNAPAGTAVAVTAMHTTNGQVNCNLCHTSTNTVVSKFVYDRIGLVNPVYNCESCHDALTPKHNKRHAVANYLNNSTDTSCAACHSKDVAVLHSINTKPTLNCDTCHSLTPLLPNTRPTIVANLSNKTAAPNFTCQSCHANAGAHNHPVTATGYETSPNVACASCHATDAATKTSELVKVHQAGMGTKFSCNVCHNATYEGSVFVRDGKIDMLKNGTTPIYCNSCHGVTGKAPAKHTDYVPHGSAKGFGPVNTLDGGSCSLCHTTLDIDNAHTRSVGGNNCNACHTNANSKGITATAVIAANLSTKSAKPGYECQSCHNPLTIHTNWKELHNSTYVSGTKQWDCAKCHSSYLPTAHDTAGTQSAVAYRIWRSSDNVNFTQIGTSNTTGFTSGGLNANTTYYYKLQAYDAAGNVSGFGSVVSAATKPTEVASTENLPGAAAYGEGINADTANDSNIRSLSPNALTRLTDSRDTFGGDSDVTIQENGSSDRWFSVRYAVDANKSTSVKLKVRASWRESDSAGNILVLPYRSDGTSINTSAVVNYKITNPKAGSSGYTDYVIDVTNAANTQKGWGWMKFRVKAGADGSRREARVSEVRIITDGLSAVNTASSPNSTIQTSTGTGDTTAPSVPSGLAAAAVSSTGISLNWTASTDSGSTATNASCAKCHSSAKAKVVAAINRKVTNGSNRLCTACHTGTVDGQFAIHKDLTAPHLTGYFQTATDADCLKCHTKQAGEFIASKASYHVISGLSSKAPAVGTYVSPWTHTTNVGCKGCHGSDGKSATTAYAKILKRPYTSTSNSGQADMLCFLCHDRATYGGGSDTTGKTGFTSESGRNYHNIGDHMVNNVVQCSWCHTAVPHATNMPHLITIMGQPNSAGNLTTRFTHPTSGRYDKSSCSAASSLCASDHP